MGLVRRPVEDEPVERPTEMGRHLLRIARESPGRWVVAYESENRARVVYLEGCLIGRAKGRIPGVTNIDGWDARVVEVDGPGGHPLYELRVRYEGPAKPGQQHLPVDPKMERLRSGENVQP